MKWLGLMVLWAAAACGESVIVATEIVSDAGTSAECAGESTRAEPAPAVLELVVDTSGTMDDELPDKRGTKWTVTRDALLAAIQALPEQTSLGVVFFPDVSNDAPVCFDRESDVSVGALGAAGSEQRRRIETAFMAQAPEGGAPTHDAYDFALNQLRASEAPGRRFVILLTDDYPTYAIGCRSENTLVDPGPLIGALGSAQQNGVDTFVVGLPGPEFARPTLSRMAFAGGTSRDVCTHGGPRYCHFDMANAQDFSGAIERTLATITDAALNCTFAVPTASGGSGPDLDQLQVSLSVNDGPAEAIERNSAGPCDEGWRPSRDGSMIELCESTCAQVRERRGRLELRTECATEAR
jgi:hypothetical protein